MTNQNNAAQPMLTDDEIEALAKKHIAPHADRLHEIMPHRVPYQQTEQFRRVKALIGDVLSKLRAPVADERAAFAALAGLVPPCASRRGNDFREGYLEAKVDALRVLRALASAHVAGEALNDLQALQWAEKYGIQWALHTPDAIREVIADAQRLAAPQASAESVDLPGIDADRLRTIAASGSQTAMTNALLNVARALKQPQATVVDKSANLQGSQVDGSTEMQGQVDGGQQPKRYVVLKASGSRYAYVNDTQEGRSINRFDVLKGDGWRYAHEFADRMNNEHARAALSATQPEQGERDA
ncbi:hypothetical protein [Achromobacter xylosoxidans]|uniref:hypothetical protein n=1 Tax=Alcaligenes xylosoxydans xylosoxydans TaxID=85698 RepID=UPI00097121C2|nr:hypothetical protein [Achromobacter xylosoxidans]OMG86805.1 hypothetical protein BIZ53_04175 [Achromobacter xylosoxidans]